MPLIRIDNQEIEVQKGARLLDVAGAAGVTIPHYCYHPALSIVGSCRMCMVEIEGMPKLQTACSTLIAELPEERKVDGKYDMVIHTSTEKVAAARSLMLEFLLLNHPLDCPVCDQAGECDLQDYSFQYGSAHSRFIEDKRVRPVEELGSGVVINQNRCIMCTRCVRFTREISGASELFVQHRGNRDKISIFPGEPLNNPLAGNVADICPVGALLLKDYIHSTRVWHLKRQASVCTECSTGCSISVDAHQGRIYRIVSRANEQANGYFICDKGRYAFHGYEDGKLTAPQIKSKQGWKDLSWDKAYKLIKDKVAGHGGSAALRGLASPTFTNESNFMLGHLMVSVSDKKNIALLPIETGEAQKFPGGFEISGDSGGNRQGVEDLIPKLAAKPGDLTKGEIGVLIILDGDGRSTMNADLRKLLSAAPFKVVLASNASELTEAADLVLPVGTPFQREGTLTSYKGLVQWLEPALALEGQARAAWQVMAELTQLLTGETSLYTCAGDVTWKINQTVSTYSQVTRFKLGEKGRFVKGAA